MLIALPLQAQPDCNADEGFQYCYQPGPDSSSLRPLVILLPGFNQHSRSPEFEILQTYLEQEGYAWLMLDPPQHGLQPPARKHFTWGRQERDDLIALVNQLAGTGLFKRHPQIHLLGFSIGAKVVLRVAADARTAEWPLVSVLAIAPPYRVADINGRFSAAWNSPTSGARSSRSALERAGAGRLLSMISRQLPSLAKPHATPAQAISQIHVPVLLLHSHNDWLTRASHSLRLSDRARPEQAVARLFIKSPAHAEDMFTHDGDSTRAALLRAIGAWLAFSATSQQPTKAAAFDELWQQKAQKALTPASFVAPQHISRVEGLTLPDPGSGFWHEPAHARPASFQYQTMVNADSDAASVHHLSLGIRSERRPFWQRATLGIAWTGSNGQRDAIVTLPLMTGSLPLLRRVSYLRGVHGDRSRRLWRADLALSMLDFQIIYGKFARSVWDAWQIAANWPLLADGRGRYYFGMLASRFLRKPAASAAARSLQLYAALGVHSRLPIQIVTSWRAVGDGFALPGSRWQFGLQLAFGDN